MIKRVIYAAAVLAGMLALATSCLRDKLPGDAKPADGYIAISFGADIPPMPAVGTRSVDPDGGGVQNMTLFCFDSYGLFITTAQATVSPEDPEYDEETGNYLISGTFSAKVPQNTRTIHFLANQIMTGFKESDFYSQSESEVMASLEGSSGMMVYWARFEAQNDLATELKEIELLRNHARIRVKNPENAHMAITGMAVYNTNAFGTVAPYHPTQRFVRPGKDNGYFVTLPHNTAMLSDVYDVTENTSQYVFESENAADKPVSVILRGHPADTPGAQDSYYRVMLIDEQGEQLPICRNISYEIEIRGELAYGQATFDDALTAAATNNVWISIQDNIDEVSDGKYTLKVNETSRILRQEETVPGQDGQSRTIRLGYTLTGATGITLTPNDGPLVTWLDGNTVGTQGITNDFNHLNGEGWITVSLRQFGENDQKLEGTLLVKKGMLQRKIKVIAIREQQFIPIWVASQVYGNPSTDAEGVYGEHVTLMFTIPETCPAELFPLRVLIGTEDLDVRAAAGMELPIIRRGEADFGDTDILNSKGDPIDFKYVYEATQPGVQRVYFRTILPQAGNGVKTNVTVESEHFKRETKEVTYTSEQYMIEVFGLEEYQFRDNDDEFANDETIYYRLVPQKNNAYVQFNIHLHNNATEKVNGDYGEFVPALPGDEFLIYSQHLNHITDDEAKPEGVAAFDCRFWPVSENLWTTSGRVHMFKPRDPSNPPSSGEAGNYSIYMRTNTPKSAEVVRIASNTTGENLNPEVPGSYQGRGYRSTSFELANYNPFRFAARIDNQGADATDNAEEPMTGLEWAYADPETREVDIEFDVTSFRGTDNRSVDPFGEAFEIYIDAPMLTIDAARLAGCNLTEDKLRPDPSVAGRFIYTVEADREKERVFGIPDLQVIKPDTPLSGISGGDPRADQTGERKRLPFKTNQVVSAGDITLSSNETKVVYFRKMFRVTNPSVTGQLKYLPEGAAETSVIPNGASVSFAEKRTGSRIGSMSVGDDGHFELRLRKEYNPSWLSEIELHYTTGNVGYHNENQTLTLGQFIQNPNITLVKATE